MRDIDTHLRTGKRTLAVRLGREHARVLYAGLLLATYVALPVGLLAADGPAWGLLALASLPLAARPVRAVRTRTDGPALNAALAATGALLAAFSLLLTVGLLIAA